MCLAFLQGRRRPPPEIGQDRLQLGADQPHTGNTPLAILFQHALHQVSPPTPFCQVALQAAVPGPAARVWTRPALRGLVALAFLGSLCSIPLVTFLPVFAKEVFRGGAGRYSALLAAFGCGAVLGGLVVAATASRMRRRGLIGALGLLSYGVLTAAFGLSRSPVLSFAFLVAAGACLMVVFSSFMTLVQTSVGDALRGRVVSIYGLAFRGGMPLGNLAAGAAAAVAGAPAVLVACGLALVVGGGVVAARRGKDGVAAM